MAPAHLDAVLERLPLRVEAGEGRQQRGVDVQDPAGEGADEDGREEAHEAGEADEVDLRARAGSRRARRRSPRACWPRWSRKTAGMPACARALEAEGRPRRSRRRRRSRRPARPAAAASMRACRFEPRPLTRTPSLFSRRAAHSQETPEPATTRADHEARLAAPLERVLDLVQVAGRDDDDHADAHVEGAVHLLVGDAPALLDQAEERRHLPGARGAARAPRPCGQDARDVAREAAAGDVDERPHLVALEERLERGEVAAVRRRAAPRPTRGAELGQVRVDAVAEGLEEHLARERVAVRVQARPRAARGGRRPRARRAAAPSPSPRRRR